MGGLRGRGGGGTLTIQSEIRFDLEKEKAQDEKQGANEPPRAGGRASEVGALSHPAPPGRSRVLGKGFQGQPPPPPPPPPSPPNSNLAVFARWGGGADGARLFRRTASSWGDTPACHGGRTRRGLCPGVAGTVPGRSPGDAGSRPGRTCESLWRWSPLMSAEAARRR